jgi:hypothetical protein
MFVDAIDFNNPLNHLKTYSSLSATLDLWVFGNHEFFDGVEPLKR